MKSFSKIENGMKVIVTGGGTGGHIYPALAVATCLAGKPNVEAVYYLGKKGGLESELAIQAGFPFIGIAFAGMPRGKSPLTLLKIFLWLLNLAQATFTALGEIQKIQPAMIFGTGGYVSAPVLLAARILKIPYAVHEPDAQPGLANRFLGRYASLITTSFKAGAERLRQNPTQTILVTGNPIRQDIGQLGRDEARKTFGEQWPNDKPILLVTGGSQGARKLNMALVEILPTLLNQWNIAVLHLTGKKLYDETMLALDQADPNFKMHTAYQVKPFNSDMATWLAAANVALCRSGSLSLSEMYACALPTVLVPYPFAAADHQRRNAEASVAAGASFMLDDAECTGPRLLEVLKPLFQDPAIYNAMQQASRGLGHPEATEKITEALLQLAK